MISSYWSVGTKIILRIIIVLHQRLNCSGLPEAAMFYTCNYNIRVTHRNGANKHIFYTNQIHGGIISRLFFIHFVAPCLALHLAVKILLRLCMKIWARWPYIHLSVVFPSRMPAGPHFVTQPILLSENIPNIWHKSSTKHKRRSRQIEAIKTMSQTTPSYYHMERFYQWLRLPFLKYSIKCEKI